MEQVKTNAGQIFGIVGLVLGILCLFFAFIPYVGLIAIVPGTIAIILSIIGLDQANRNNGAKGLNIGALAVSICSVLAASIWLVFFASMPHLDEDEVEDIIKEAIEETTLNPELQKALEELEEHLDKVRMDSIKIKADSFEIQVKVKIEKE